MTTYKWVRTNLNNDVYKYYFTNSSQERLSQKDVLELLQDKDPDFFPVFYKALIDANNKSFPYRWNCSPVSKSSLDKSFEFVVKKENGLQNNSQNYSNFQTYINNSSDPYACSFKNLGKDATLIIPMPVSGKNFSSISHFTQNASLEQQENFWQQAAIKLIKETNQDGKTKWLNTQGLGVAYLHVRIDTSPKYYFFADYEKPNYTPIPRTPKQKLLANLDKICLDPTGDLANAEFLRDKIFHNKQDFINSDTRESSRVNIEGETIELKLRGGVQEEEWADGAIKKAIIDNIINNPSDWKIEKEGESEIVRNKSSSNKNWKTAFSQQEWQQIETALKNSPNKKNQETGKKWYNPLDYPLPWTIATAFSLLFIVITTTFQKRTKRKF